MKFELYYPVKTHQINQVFGGNAAYYARFHDEFGNPEHGHNGQDMFATHGEPVYAACDGVAYYMKDDHGGEGIIIKSEQVMYKGQVVTFNVINWHLCGDTDPKYPSPIPLNGKAYPVKVGDLIGHADNTGAPFESSGTHLHLGLAPHDVSGNLIEPHNGFNGCIDPAPYFNGLYAVDHKAIQNVPPTPAIPAPTPSQPTLQSNSMLLITLLQQLISYYKKLRGIN